MAGTKPPPSIRTFFQVYGSAAAADAVVVGARATATAPANKAVTTAPIAVLLIRDLSSTDVHMGALPAKGRPRVTGLSRPGNPKLTIARFKTAINNWRRSID